MGDRLPIVELYSEASYESPLFRDILINYYKSMIRFWSQALIFYRRKRFRGFYHSIWSNYDIEFKALEETMDKQYSHIKECSMALHESETKNQGRIVRGETSD